MFFGLYYAGEWVIRAVMLAVVVRRRRPATAMAWLLIIFAFPWPGLGLYLFVGRRPLPRGRRERAREAVRHLGEVATRIEAQAIASNQAHLIDPIVDPRLQRAVSFVRRLGSLPAAGGNAVEFIDRPDALIDRLIADIDESRDHVHLLFYIFNLDNVGNMVADALGRAVKRGVTCRVLLDAVGSDKPRNTVRRLRAIGVEAHSALDVSLLRRPFARIDLRNHRKIAVIDASIGYTGSQNIVDPSYGHADLVWHDLMGRFRGPSALELQAVFVTDWFAETGELAISDETFPGVEVAGDIAVQPLPTGPELTHASFQRLVVVATHTARERVVITSPYFIPDDSVLDALQLAALRDVQVDLVLPAKSDQVLVGNASRAYYDELLEAGVNIYQFEGGLLHAKTMTIDGSASFFGTANFDIRSFSLNFEITMVIYGAQQAGILRGFQDKYIESSTRLSADEWRRRSKVRRTFQDIAKLFSPLL